LFQSGHAGRFRPERGLLVIAGPIDAVQAIKLAEAAFGDWKAQGTASAEIAPPAAQATPQFVWLQRDGSVQSTLRLGRPGIAATSPDYVPLRLASTIIGGGFSSRINQNLREDKGYTYGASAGARSYRKGGAIVGGADVRNDVTGPALKEYESEFARFGTELVPEEELAMNKRYVAGGYLINNQLQGSVAATLASNWIVGLPSDFLGNYVPMIQKVTAEQVREMGRKYFDPKAQSIVVVGDRGAAVSDKADASYGKTVGEQVKGFGDFKPSP